jgi:ubiquinone/menaquinone biosynthesis C-methylase UbiE
MSEPSFDANQVKVKQYYDRTESRLGYEYLMGGARHFGWYDSDHTVWRFRSAVKRMESVLAAKLDLPADASVLDAGCGMGVVAQFLASQAGLRVTGIDRLDWDLKTAIASAARKGLSDRTSFKWGDFHRLDFPDESFDGAYTMESLVHSDKPDAVISELFRVLRPGGRLAFFEYSHAPKEELSTEAYAVLKRVCAEAALPAWLEFEHGVLEQKLASAGFGNVASENVTARILPMFRAFSLLGRVPYVLARRLGKSEKAVNAMSAVEMYRHRQAWRYNITTAVKPL